MLTEKLQLRYAQSFKRMEEASKRVLRHLTDIYGGQRVRFMPLVFLSTVHAPALSKVRPTHAAGRIFFHAYREERSSKGNGAAGVRNIECGGER